MTYSFVCPFPCNKELKVDALNNEDAINKLMLAGAIRCRNAYNRYNCENNIYDMPPLQEEILRNIVGSCMREDCEEQTDFKAILASLHG